ncbi:hypothetical protein, partial [Sulfitobacter sp.]|uniref:hypothetical protein n=1 Tax=Sulfitobacter sp. TaxID=1903071 RepID=UPI003EF85A42
VADHLSTFAKLEIKLWSSAHGKLSLSSLAIGLAGRIRSLPVPRKLCWLGHSNPEPLRQRQ